MGLEVLAQVAGPDETDADATKEESCRKPPANKNILNAAQGLTVEVSVELGSTELSVGEVLSLKVGDVVRLDSTVNDVLSARVQGRVAFKGRPGLRNGRLAFQVCQLGEQLEE